MIYQTNRIIEHDGLRYVVQARQCLDGSIQQRHVWFKTQLGEHDPPLVEKWIPAGTRKLDVMTRNMVAAPHILDEMGEALNALRDIANGHNDARGRAAEALEIILKDQ